MHSETNAEPRACGVVVCFFVLLLVGCAGASRRQKKRRPHDQLTSFFPGRDFDRVPLQYSPTRLFYIAVPPGARPNLAGIQRLRLHAPFLPRVIGLYENMPERPPLNKTARQHSLTGLHEHMLKRPPLDKTARQHSFLPAALGHLMDDYNTATARFDKEGSREMYDENDDGWRKAVMDKQERSYEEEEDLSALAKNIARELWQQKLLLNKIEEVSSGINPAQLRKKKLPENSIFEIPVKSDQGRDLDPMESDLLEEGDGKLYIEEDIDQKVRENLKRIIEESKREQYTDQNVKDLQFKITETSDEKPDLKMKTDELIKKIVKGSDGKNSDLNISETRNVTPDLNLKEIVKNVEEVDEKHDSQDQGKTLLIKITEESVKQADAQLTGREGDEGPWNGASGLQTQKGREPTNLIKVEHIPEDSPGETGLHQNVVHVHGHLEEKSTKDAVDSRLPRRPEGGNKTKLVEFQSLPPPPLMTAVPIAWSLSEDSSVTAVLPVLSVERRLNSPDTVKVAKTQNDPRYSALKQTSSGEERISQRERILTKDSTAEKEGVVSPAPADGKYAATDEAAARASPVSTTKLATESKELATEAAGTAPAVEHPTPKVDSKGSYFSDIASIFRVFSLEGSTDAVTYAIMMAAAMTSLMLILCCVLLTCQVGCCKSRPQHLAVMRSTEDSLARLDTDPPLYIRFSPVRKSRRPGQHFLLSVMDESNVSVAQGGDSSEEEVFSVSKIQKADTKGPLAKIPWSKQGTPY